MKTTTSLTSFMLVTTSLVADTLQIGVFTLPYRFEDTNITDIVRYVATNDVIAYNAATTSFTPPYTEQSGIISVRQESTPDTTLYLPPILENGIKFYIENGQTNCVIKQSLTDAAKDIESELQTRSNLATSAGQFIEDFRSGATTNLPISAQRALMRTISSGILLPMGDDISDAEVLESQEETRQYFSFLPICILDTKYVNVGTNRYFTAKVPTDTPQNPSYARSIDALSLIYADGHWSFLY